ncbi:uncharacterized protein TNCV_2343541 [Trichonephila clavipes]|nr:uncharacterized protein TNCV_2343541 [Trichonephila clavipes]
MINILNRLGHCCNYNTLEELETEATISSVNRSQICPPGIIQGPSLSTGVAFDNFDRYVDTLTGKGNRRNHLPKYNLNKVDETHPGLKNDFMNGCFGIKRTDKPFSSTPIDLTLETTINAEAARCLSDVSADLQPNRINIYGKQLSDFNEIFENNINPFDESLDKDSLYNIATAKPVPENVANFLLNIEKNGEDLRKQFITECAED